MAYKKGLENLKNYIEQEEKDCKKLDAELAEKWSERNFIVNMQQAVLNQRNMNLRILKDILQELETDDLKLQITFRGPKASDLPHLVREPINEDGIRLEGKGGLFQASVEAYQYEFVVFWVSNTVALIGGAITIADFIHTKLKNYKNTKIKVGSHEVDSSASQEEIQKIIQKELKRLTEEVKNIKKDLE